MCRCKHRWPLLVENGQTSWCIVVKDATWKEFYLTSNYGCLWRKKQWSSGKCLFRQLASDSWLTVERRWFLLLLLQNLKTYMYQHTVRSRGSLKFPQQWKLAPSYRLLRPEKESEGKAKARPRKLFECTSVVHVERYVPRQMPYTLWGKQHTVRQLSLTVALEVCEHPGWGWWRIENGLVPSRLRKSQMKDVHCTLIACSNHSFMFQLHVN